MHAAIIEHWALPQWRILAWLSLQQRMLAGLGLQIPHPSAQLQPVPPAQHVEFSQMYMSKALLSRGCDIEEKQRMMLKVELRSQGFKKHAQSLAELWPCSLLSLLQSQLPCGSA